jgi:hypothetical protein
MRILRRFFDTSVAISLFSSTVEYSIWQCEAFQVNFFWSSHFYIEQGITLHLVAWAISFEALVSVFISFFVRFAVDSIRGILLVTSLILSTIGFRRQRCYGCLYTGLDQCPCIVGSGLSAYADNQKTVTLF